MVALYQITQKVKIMKQIHYSKFAVAVLVLYCGMIYGTVDPKVPFLTPLRARGFSLIPAPQQVKLGDLDVVVDGSWMVESKVGTDEIAIKRLIKGASDLHGLTFSIK